MRSNPREPHPRRPAVTVLVPAWNVEGRVAQALASVLDDPSLDVQVVVVDDASTDSTARVVAAIAAADRRVELIRAPENGGPSAARNLGLPHCRGEWLTFLDADDRMLPGGLAALVDAALRHDALVVVGQRVWSDGTSTWISSTYDQPDIREPGRKSILANPGLMYYASGTGKLFRRALVDDLRFEGRVLGDQPWTIRALLRAGDRIQVIERDVYEWHRPPADSSESSITSRKHDSAALAAEAVLVAIGALRAVRDEAARLLADEADIDRVTTGYIDRLMRADFRGPVDRALSSLDPGMVPLFEALDTFVRAAPARGLASATRLRHIVLPPLVYWSRMLPQARTAFLSMVSALPPEAVAAAGGGRRSRRLLLEAIRTLQPTPARILVGPILRMAGAVAGLAGVGRAPGG